MKLTLLKQTHCSSAMLILTLLAIGISKSTYAQTLDVCAGVTGFFGYSGDGGPATAAHVTHPYGMAIDASSNIYFADEASNTVRRVDAITGIITTVAGYASSGGYNGDGIAATSAELYDPQAVAIDNAGNLYICDGFNFRVRKVNTSGIISTIAGTGYSGISGDGGLAIYANVDYTVGVAVDGFGNVYISGSNRIRKIDATTGKISTVVGTGTGGYSGDGGPATSAQIWIPRCIKVDAIGTLYIADNNNSRIRKVATSGIISTIAGNVTAGYSGDGGAATSAELNYPYDIAFDGNGNLLIADEGNYVIRKVNSAGIISTVAGNNSISSNALCNAPTSVSVGDPISIVFDSYGCFYVGDFYNYRVLKYSTGLSIYDVDINSLCAPLSPTFTVSPSGGIPPYTYSWSANPGNAATLNNYTLRTPHVTAYTYAGCANFNLTVSDNSTCFSAATRHVVACLNNNPTYDLAMRDSHSDMYAEPNNQATITGDGNIWLSPDLWNRINPDDFTTHQDPCYGCTNYMYTTIRNVGCAASPTTAQLKLYWTVGGFAEAWPADWTTTLFPGTFLPQGLQIATIPLSTSIPPGGKTEYKTSWIPPNPGSYYPGSPSMELCFLARIEDGHNSSFLDGMTYDEGLGISTNVSNNNNIVTRNTEVIFVNYYSPRAVHLFVGNVNNIAQAYSLQFINEHTISGGTSTLNQFVSVTVYLGNVFNSWIQGGAQGTYTNINYQNQSVTFDGTNTVQLDNIMFQAGEEDLIQADFTMNCNNNCTQMQDETVHFRQLSLNNQTPEIVGNYTFFVTYGSDVVNDGGGGGQNKTARTTGTTYINAHGNNVKVFPNPATTTLNFEFPLAQSISVKLMDITGRLIAEQSLENATKTVFDTKDFTPGLYMYQITIDGKVQSGKVVVEK